MRELYQAAAIPHYVAGFVALVSFWLPLVVTKGGSAHKKAGNVFFWSMILVSLSSFMMAAISMWAPELVHPSRSADASRIISVFLFYLGIVSITVVLNARSMTRNRNKPEQQRTPTYKALNLLCFAGSLLILTFGLLWNNTLLLAMSPIGILVANGYRKHLKQLDDKIKTWRAAHASTMIIGGICIHTAFIAGGGTRFLPPAISNLGWWIWLVPTAIGVPFLFLIKRKYSPKPI